MLHATSGPGTRAAFCSKGGSSVGLLSAGQGLLDCYCNQGGGSESSAPDLCSTVIL